MKKNIVIFSGFFILLAACTLAPKDMGQAYMFALTPAETSVQGKGDGGALTVALPVAAPELDTYRIALVSEGKRRDYYAGARWPDFLPVLVQDNITKTLESSRLFKNVTTDQAGVKGERILKLALRDFQAEYSHGQTAPVIKVRLVASLLNRHDGAVISSFEVKSEGKAVKDGLPEIQAAFAGAFKEVQKQLVERLGKSL